MMTAGGTFLEERRETLRTSLAVNGIERVSVTPPDRNIVIVKLVHPAPGETNGVPASSPALLAENVLVSGGDRRRGLNVMDLSVDGDELTLTLDRAGDFSSYTLTIDHPGFDPVLRSVQFGFRSDCPDAFDPCATETTTTEEDDSQASTYLAKDYTSFRQVMLDHLATAIPEWSVPEVPDAGLTLVELMAHYGDLLSYRQDAVANEAYLHTARLRTSLRRHAALLGYAPDDGLSARTFVHVEVTGSGVATDFAAAKFKFATPSPLLTDVLTDVAEIEGSDLLASGAQVFEPSRIDYVPAHYDPASNDTQLRRRPVHLNTAHNELPIHDWGDDRAVLEAGTTEAWIHRPPGNVTLRKGDFILLEQVRDPHTWEEGDANENLRQIVQLVEEPEPATDSLPPRGVGSAGSNPANTPPFELFKLRWHSSDALGFDLPVGHVGRETGQPMPLAVIRGNMVLCDHGLMIRESAKRRSPVAGVDEGDVSGITSLAELDVARQFRPLLRERNLSLTSPIRFSASPDGVATLLSTHAVAATANIHVTENDGTAWRAVPSLLETGDNDRVFVAETEADGRTYLRFANPDSFGQEFPADTEFTLRYRVGRGATGNVGAGTVRYMIADPSVLSQKSLTVKRIYNPLAARGGRDAESADSLRKNAIAAIGVNERAVTAADHAARAASHPLVEQAVARTIWHGSWNTVVIAVDLQDGAPLTDGLREQLEAHVEPYRLMGQDIRIEEPRYAPLDIVAHICVDAGHREDDVFAAVRDALSPGLRRDGRPGFFHPDRMSFGSPIYLSRIFEAIYRVTGVADVRIVRFSRWDRPRESFLDSGVFHAPDGEIPILANDPNRPERGRLTLRNWVAEEVSS